VKKQNTTVCYQPVQSMADLGGGALGSSPRPIQWAHAISEGIFFRETLTFRVFVAK